MVFQIFLIHHLMHKSRCVFHVCGIGFRVGTIKRKIEFEIGELFFECVEVLEIKDFGKRTCTVEILHLAICCV